MKKIACIVCLVMLLPLLSGCVLHKITVMTLRGDKVRAPIGSYSPIEGSGVRGKIVRQVWITDEKGREVPKPKDFIITEKGEGKTTDDSITTK